VTKDTCTGVYWGASDESDDGDQSIRCTLTFDQSGELSGHGKDGVDGAYKIKGGRWGALPGDSALTLAWVEVYDEGFEVVVKGTYDFEEGKVKASFSSDRGVDGKFELTRQPSVFD